MHRSLSPLQKITKLLKFQEVFCRLPLPYVDEEFKIDLTWKDMENKMDLPPYVHIRRSILFLLCSILDQLYFLSTIIVSIILAEIAYMLKNY